MKDKLSLIIVSGPNASGKTTFVENNFDNLVNNNFEIILPDKILKYATSLTDRPVVIGEYIDNAITAQKNILIETPFQNQAFITRIEEIKKMGYETYLYQIFLNDPDESVARVNDRKKKGGLFISNKEALDNYLANFKSISNIFYKFNHAYFIDNTKDKNFALTAYFQAGVLAMFKSTDNNYLKELFEVSSHKGYISDVEMKCIIHNTDYKNENLSVKRNSRLKF